MKLNEDYIVPLMDDAQMIFEIISVDSDFLGWVFQVNSMKFEEDDETETARLTIDYNVLKPTPDQIESMGYTGDSDPRVTNVIGSCIEDMIDNALKNNAFKISDEGEGEMNGEYCIGDVLDSELKNTDNGTETDAE